MASSTRLRLDNFLQLTATVCLVGVWSWVAQRGFWLDELITVFLIQVNSTAELTQRVVMFHSQTPLYYWIAWKWGALFGVSEMSLRLLSACFVSLAAVVLSRAFNAAGFALTSRWIVLLWLCSGAVFGSAAEARPYALALLAVSLSFSFLLDVERDFAFSSILCFALSLLVVFYVHYTYVLVAIPECLWLYISVRQKRGSPMWGVFLAVVVVLLLGWLPVREHLRILQLRYQVSSWISAPSWRGAVDVLAFNHTALWVFVPLICGLIFRRLEASRAGSDSGAPLPSLKLLVLLWTSAPVLLFCASMVNSESVFLERYARWNAMGFAGVVGAIMLRTIPDAARRYVFFASCLLLLLGSAGLNVRRDRWQEMASILDRGISSQFDNVVLYNGMVETGIKEWVTGSERHSFFAFPLTYYSKFSGKIWILPFRFNSEWSVNYTNNIFSELAGQVGNFVIVAREYLPTFPSELARRMPLLATNERAPIPSILRPDPRLSLWLIVTKKGD